MPSSSRISPKRLAALAVALPVVSCQLSLAETTTWTGILSSFWGNSANWSSGSVPASDADLLFDGGAFLFTVDLGAQNRTAASITIDSATAYTFEDSIPGQSLLTSSIAVESGTGHGFAVPIVLTADGTFLVRTDLTVSGVISGTYSLAKQSEGTLTLTGANTYAGGTTILGGTLQIGNGGTSGSLFGDVDTGDADSNGTLAFNRSDAITFDGLISGSGGLTQAGSGSLTLTAASTFGGATHINAGSIILGHGSALQNSTVNINVANGLDLGGADATLGALAGSGGLALAGGITLTVGGNGTDTTYSGVLSGSGALTKTGAGTLTLSATNTFSGATTINEGSILLVETDYYNRSLQNSTVTLNVDGGLDLGTVNDASLGALAGGGDLSFQDVEVHVGANNASTTYSGVFTSGTTTLYKEGTGTWTLTGSGFTDGTLVIDEGTVVFDGAAGRLYSITADGGTLTLTNGTNLNLSNDLEGTGDIEINGAATRVSAATLHVYGPVNVADGAEVSVTNDLSFLNNKTLTIDQATVLAAGFSSSFAGSKIQLSDAEGAPALTINGDSNSTFVGVISDHTSGPGSLTKTGAGTLTLSGANTYSGGTTISGGTLQIGNGGITGSILGDVDTGDADANGTLAFNRSDDFSFAGAISGAGGFTKAGAGALTLSGAIDHGGTTVINGGAIILDGQSAVTFGGLSGSGNLTLGTTTLSVGGNDADTSYSGALSGSGALTKTGAGTLTLSATNPFSGATTINEGSILLLETGYYNRSLQNSTVTLNVDGGLDLGTVDAVYLGALAGGGDLSFQDVDVYVGGNDASTTYSGVFTSGTTSIYKEGTGTWTLTGTGFTDGTLDIDEGAVVLDGAAGRLYSIGTDGGTLTLTNGTDLSLSNGLGGIGDIEINGAATRVSAATLYVYGPVNVADGAEVSVTNGLSFLSNNTLTIDQATLLAVGFSSSYANSKIQLSDPDGASALTINANSDTTFVGVISDHTSGPGSLLKTGSGTLTLTGANTYSGGTTIGGGTLQIGNGGTTGTLASDVVNDSTLLVNRSDAVSLDGVISGTGDLTNIGAGALTLNAANTFSGTTSTSGGSIVLGHGLALQNSTVVLATSADLDLNGQSAVTLGGLSGSVDLALGSTALTVGGNDSTTTFSGVLSGTGSLTKEGSGTLTLGTENTFTGDTTINEGDIHLEMTGSYTNHSLQNSTVHLNVDGGLSMESDGFGKVYLGALGGAGDLSIESAEFYIGGNGASTTYSGTIAQGTEGSLYKTGSGTWTLTGSGHEVSVLTISDGTVVLDGANGSVGGISIAQTGALVLQNGAVFSTNNAINSQGDLTVTGSGTLLSYSDVTGSATTTVADGGSIVIADSWRLASDSTLTIDGGTVSLNKFSTGSGTIYLSDPSGGTALTVGTGNGSSTFSGTIADHSSGPGSLTKTGAGTLTLTGANTFSGTTTISAGTLALASSGALASSTITAASGATFDVSAVSGGFTLGSGQTLGGGGAVFGAFTIGSGAVLAPGNSPGTLSFAGDLTLGAGSTLLVEIGGTSQGTEYDLVSVGGAATLGGSLAVTWHNGFTASLGDTFTFLSAAGGVSGSFSSTALPDLGGGLAWSYGQTSDSAFLTVVSAIPEPATWSVVAGAMALGFVATRRRRGMAGGVEVRSRSERSTLGSESNQLAPRVARS